MTKLLILSMAALGACVADDASPVDPDAGETDAVPVPEVPDAAEENAALGIVVQPTSALRVDERASTMIEVRLTARPAAPVTVYAGIDDDRVASISPGALTFTADDWQVVQRIAVTGVADDDSEDEGSKLRLKAEGVEPVVLEVEVIDRVELAIAPSTLDYGSLVEGTGGWFAVVLTAPPPADLVVEVASSDPDAASAIPAAMTFTTSDWDIPQKVNLAALHDDDTLDQGLSIGLTAAGVPPQKVAVQVIDDDGATP